MLYFPCVNNRIHMCVLEMYAEFEKRKFMIDSSINNKRTQLLRDSAVLYVVRLLLPPPPPLLLLLLLQVCKHLFVSFCCGYIRMHSYWYDFKMKTDKKTHSNEARYEIANRKGKAITEGEKNERLRLMFAHK